MGIGKEFRDLVSKCCYLNTKYYSDLFRNNFCPAAIGVVTCPKPEMRRLDPLMRTLLCLILFLIVISPTTNLIAGQPIFSNKDDKTELSVFNNDGTNVDLEWLRWIQNFCPRVEDGGQSKSSIFEMQSGNETKGDLAHIPFRAFSKSDRGDWPQNLKPGSTPGWIRDFHLRVWDDGQFKMSIQDPLLHPVSGECSSHENHKGNEQCYGRKLIDESQSKVNNSESYEDHTRTDVEYRSTTTHVKNGENDVKLRMLVLTKNTFPEFVKVDHDPEGNRIMVTGYAVDVFKEVMNSLAKSVSFEFFACENGSYDELIQLLHVNGYDGVVGDITITFNRSKYGDFTQAYMMAGVSMIVPVVGGRKSLWWFLKPFTVDLWGLMLALFLLKMLMLWYIDHRENNPALQGTFLGKVWETLLLGFSMFGIGQTRELKSNWSRSIQCILILELLASILFYHNALQPMASSNNDGPVVTCVKKLIMNGDYVGYQKGSFVLGLLKDMGFHEQKLKAYSSMEEYATALSRGSCNNGVSAIIDEIPYIKLFLAKYDVHYTMAGPIFRPDSGFGFLFKRGCTITRDVSDGVLKFKEGEMMSRLEKKWFGYYKPNPSSTQTPQRLSVHDFLGLLLITIPITVLTFVGFIVSKCRETNLNSSDVQKTGRVGNGGSHAGTEGGGQTRPIDKSPQMANAQINLGNTGVTSFYSSEVQMTRRVGNGGSHAGTVGSDQTKPTDNSPQMANAQINLGNTGVASRGNVDPSVDSTCSAAEEVDTPPNSLDIGRGPIVPTSAAAPPAPAEETAPVPPRGLIEWNGRNTI